MNRRLLFITALCALSRTLSPMGQIPSLQQNAINLIINDITNATSIADLSDGGKIDNLIGQTNQNLLVQELLEDNLRHRLGAPLYTLVTPQHAGNGKVNDDLFPSIFSNLIYTINPKNGTIFSVDKKNVKVLTLINGNYRTTDLITIPEEYWTNITFNPSNNDLIINSEEKITILQLDQNNHYQVTQELVATPEHPDQAAELESKFLQDQPIVFNEKTSNLYRLGITRQHMRGPLRSRFMYVWHRQQNGQYVEQQKFLSSPHYSYEGIITDPVHNNLIVIAIELATNNITLNIYHDQHDQNEYHILQKINLGHYRGLTYNTALYTFNKQHGLLFIHFHQQDGARNPFMKLQRQIDGTFIQQEIPIKLDLTTQLTHTDRYGHPNNRDGFYCSMAYNQIDNSILYEYSQRYSGEPYYNLIKFDINSGTQSIKIPTHKVKLNLKSFDNNMIGAHIYHGGFDSLNFYKAEAQNFYTDCKQIKLLNTLSLRQLLLLGCITKQIETLKEESPIWIHPNYQEDLRIISPLLDKAFRLRCHISFQSSFVTTSTSEKTANNILTDPRMQSLKQHALQQIVNRLITCSLVDPCSIDNQIQQLHAATQEVQKDVELMLKKTLRSYNNQPIPVDTLTLKQLILLNILEGHHTPHGHLLRKIHRVYVEDYRVVTSFFNHTVYPIKIVGTPTVKHQTDPTGQPTAKRQRTE